MIAVELAMLVGPFGGVLGGVPVTPRSNLLIAAPAVILVLLLICLFAVAWARRIRSAMPRFQMSVEELALVSRAAKGEKDAAEALRRLADTESAALRRRAATDRNAALRYRDRIREQLRTLEPLHGELASMDLEDARRQGIERHVAQQQTEALRELAWVEARLERRGR